MFHLMLVHLFGLMTPGPDFFYVSRMAASNTHRNTVCGIVGIVIGVAIWAAAAMFGLAILFTTMPSLHGVIMILGGGYLSYIGVLLAKSRSFTQIDDLSDEERNAQTTVKKEILKGLLVNLSNAKVVVYFSSVMALVLKDITSPWQIALAFIIIVVETFAYFYTISLLFSRPLAKHIYSRYSRYIDNAAGVVFLIFGVLLVYNGLDEVFKLYS